MINVWWAPGPKPGNYGDILTPHILDYLEIKYNYTTSFDHLFIGSIASKAKSGTTVLGSGFIQENDKVNSKALYLLVRGPRSYQKVIDAGGIDEENVWNDIMGDPALLLPMLVDESKKKYDYGIIPHYKDYLWVKNAYPNERVIDILNEDPIEVCKQITECRAIISSSLHGVITGHAYGIPTAWAEFSNKVVGKGFKFKDHYEALGLEAISSTVEEPIFTTVTTTNMEDIRGVFLDTIA